MQPARRHMPGHARQCFRRAALSHTDRQVVTCLLSYGPVADIYKALADRTRRIILDELAERDGQTLFEIGARLASKHQLGSTRQAISQHLGVLEEAGLVRSRREGRYKYHFFNPAPLSEINRRWPRKGPRMKIAFASVYVDDQVKAMDFYTDILGFQEHSNIPIGDDFWMTVVSPDAPDGPQLQLDPAGHAAVTPYRKALVDDGIPLAQFAVDDVEAQHRRLTEAGVAFTVPPTDVGEVWMAVLDDTCGNLIQIVSQKHHTDVTPATATRDGKPQSTPAIRIELTGVFVHDQAEALAFYTDVLGFQKRHDIPLGQDSWLTVVSPDDPDGPEVLLEPSHHPAVKPYRDALMGAGIPLAQFAVDDVGAEHQRLTEAGVAFTVPPTDVGEAWIAVFDDTCGNLIQIVSI